ncbi:hypothetical protein CRENBAI_025402 [Crenichthys baileyi]|uniref:Uncharacterized protein n=1 Tax=Crenichthys baileyi TaxID=28760 RepID=A0AAV9R4V1_9TELE
MDSPEINRKQHGESTDDGDSLESGEDFVKDERSLRDGEEEDLDGMVNAIQDRAEVEAPGNIRPCPTSSAHQQFSILDFLRNFLLQHGMTETLECFETEWAELVQKGETDENRIDPIPEVYTENQRLAGELKNAVRELEEYRRAASVAAEALQRVQTTRDANRRQHRRVVQEKDRLIEEIKRLKLQCDTYQPAVKRMSEKYKAVSKQVLKVALERDKALLQGDNPADRRVSQNIDESNVSLK